MLFCIVFFNNNLSSGIWARGIVGFLSQPIKNNYGSAIAFQIRYLVLNYIARVRPLPRTGSIWGKRNLRLSNVPTKLSIPRLPVPAPQPAGRRSDTQTPTGRLLTAAGNRTRRPRSKQA